MATVLMLLTELFYKLPVCLAVAVMDINLMLYLEQMILAHRQWVGASHEFRYELHDKILEIVV